MKRMCLIGVVALWIVPSVTHGLTKAYDVVPYRNCVALTDSVPPGNQVSQYFRMTLDSVSVVSVWVGDRGNGAAYHVEVRDSAGLVLAQTLGNGVTPEQSWAWLPCTLVTTSGKRPVRGKTYKVTVSRTSGAPISYAYDSTNKYKYGCLYIPGEEHDSADAAMRIYGYLDPLDSLDWGATGFIPVWYSSCPNQSNARRIEWQDSARNAGVGWVVDFADWNVLWDSLGDRCDFYDFDAHLWEVTRQCTAANPQPVVCLLNCAKWASSRVDSGPTG